MLELYTDDEILLDSSFDFQSVLISELSEKPTAYLYALKMNNLQLIQAKAIEDTTTKKEAIEKWYEARQKLRKIFSSQILSTVPRVMPALSAFQKASRAYLTEGQ